MSVRWNFELTSRWPFLQLSKKEMVQCCRKPGASTSCSHANSLDFRPHPIQGSKRFFQWPPLLSRTASLLLTLPTLSVASANSFRTTSIFLPQDVMYKRVPSTPGGRTCYLLHLTMPLLLSTSFPAMWSFTAQ